MSTPSVLLLGPAAASLAARLEASGYAAQLEAGTPPDAVVLDATASPQIPQLRAQFGRVPILLDLGHDSLEARSHCLTTGADDFWLSSLGPSDLLMRLRLHLGLRRPSSRPMASLQVGDLEITPSLRQVKRGLRTIALTAREYQLLLFLIERADQVLSRETILAAIWSDQQGASSNVIEVYVRYLRQKLEAAGERRLIHTVRGQGYCLALKPPPLPS